MVRATFAGFSTALSALQANQKRLDIVGQNLSNMGTVGYTRQQLETSSLNYTNPISHYMSGSEPSVGFGVRMDKVSQIRDPYLDAQYRSQMNKAGYTDSMQSALDTLSKALDESNFDGIRQAFDDIQSTLGNVHDPDKVNDLVYESELRSRMQSLTNLLNDAARQIETAEKAEFSKLDGTGTSEGGAVQVVNDLLQQIGNLNGKIKNNQILGQPSLELLDERNNLLDKLGSYIPIEVSYFKDAAHDGLKEVNGQMEDAPEELYELDAYGNPICRKAWPDDLKVELLYTDADGQSKRLTLINGTEGGTGGNYGSISITGGSQANPTAAEITFTGAASSGGGKAAASASGIQFSGGSIQASLDMLGKQGTGDYITIDDGAGNITATKNRDDVKGHQYYMHRLDTLAQTFANVMNGLNNDGGGDPTFNFDLLDGISADPDDPSGSALNIGIRKEWTSGEVHITKGGNSSNDTVLNMLEAMTKAHPELGNKSFADYMNNVSTILANDSYRNANSLKTNVIVLNGIQNSRDSVSGVSLDEEASNMMSYISAYNAASRLMTTLDEALNTLINGTGLVGR